eukprot:572942-Pleurochrysis_carterae.AAC.2
MGESIWHALYLKTDLKLSDRAYAKARLALSKSYSEKEHAQSTGGWRSRVWYITEPFTGQSLSMPEPLVPRWRWFTSWRNLVAKFGSTCDAGR